MIRLLVHVTDKFKSLPLKKKLFISYSAPIIAICVLITAAVYPLFSFYYEKMFRDIQVRSCIQASNFISQYIGNMHYISSIIENSASVSGIISEAGLSGQRPLGDQYREFWKFKNEMLKISVNNSIYRIGIYVPDSIVYASDDYYFYPESRLEQRADFKLIKKKLSNGSKVFVKLMEISSYSPSVNSEEYMALLGTVSAEDSSGKKQEFITKVGIPVSELDKILQKANASGSGLVYLLDGAGKLAASSDDAEYGRLASASALPSGRTDAWSTVKIPGSGTYYVIWNSVQKFGWQMFCLIPASEYRRQGAFIVVVILVMFLMIACSVFAVSYFLSSFYTKRLTALDKNMKELGSGTYTSPGIVQISESGDEIDGILRNFNLMAEELQRLMDEQYKQGKSVVTTELRALQSQINPHFLYNTLDLINWEAMRYKAGNISEIAQNLGQFYRLSLNHGKAAILISRELKHVESYVSIENVHFDGAIHLEIIVPEAIQSYACLGIILQPFVENSIVHGIAEHSDIKECSVCISAEFDGSDIVFDIRDNGPGISTERQGQILGSSSAGAENGYGIQNINLRLRLCYGEPYGVSFDSAPGRGTTVHIRIPVMTLEELEQRLA